MTTEPAVGTPSWATRIGTLSPYDFGYWAGTFVAPGEPTDYQDNGPETDGTTLVAWAAAQVGVTMPTVFMSAIAAMSNYIIPVETALNTRGALVVCSDYIAVCMGLNDVVGVINGRYYQFKTTAASTNPVWEYGAHVPGLIYG